MRIRHSLKAFIPVILMLVSERTVLAQGGPPMAYGGMPVVQQAPGPYGMPMAGPPQAPASYGMYPYQSPFQGMYEQTYQRDGTWFQKSVNGFGPANKPRESFVNLDFTRTINRKMSGLVGADGVQTYFQQNDPASDGITPGLDQFNYFDAVKASIIPQLKTNGIRLSGGFWNADDSGFLYSGGFQFDDTVTFDARERALAGRMSTAAALSFQRDPRGSNQPFNTGGRSDMDILKNDILAPGVVFDAADNVSYGAYGTTFDVLDRTLVNLYGIPTTSGNTPIVLNGETAPYDLQFILKQSINTGGANAAWAFSPVYEKDNIKVRPIVGGRYFRVDETFSFYGESTLLGYTAIGDADIPVNAKTFSPNDGRTPTTVVAQTYVLPAGTTDGIVYSYINSQVVTDLAGPEIGFQYELGSKKGIQLTGSTRLAAMYNTERLKMSGDNIGNFMGIEVVPDPITGNSVLTRMYDTSTYQGKSLNAFSDNVTGTHMSPLLEQSLNANIPIFSRVPVLRNMWQLEDAKLSLGWTLLVIGQVADPNDSIVYNSSPISGEFLHYQIERNTFYQNTFNIGVNWNY